MALSSVTITYDIADLVGTDFDARRTKVYATTNVPGEAVVDTVGNKVRIGDGVGTIASDGTGSISLWVPGTGSNPASWQTTIHVDYAQRRPGGKRETRDFGPFTITTAGDLADLIAEQEAPPTYLSTVTALLDSKVEQAQTAQAGAEAALTAAQALVLSDLGTSDGQMAAVASIPSSDFSGVLAATIDLAIGMGEVSLFTISQLAAAEMNLAIDGEVPIVTTSASATTIPSNGFARLLRIGGSNANDADLVNDPKFLVGGTPAMKPSGGDPARLRVPQVGASNPQVARYVPSFTFTYDGSAFEWYGAYPSVNFTFRLLVDGRLSIIDGTYNMTGKQSVKFDFGTAKTRVITLVVDDPDFLQINYQPGYTVTRPAASHSRRLFMVGDSIARGTYVNGSQSSAYTLARLLGCDEVWNASIGGTGWTAVDGTQFGGNRLPEITPFIRPTDFVVFFGSRNDPSGSGPNLAAVTAAVTATLNVAAVDACLNVFVATNITVINTLAAAIIAGAAGAGRPGIDASGWITGNGTIAAPNGTGNADRYMGADGIHPGTAEAYRYLGRRLHAGIRATYGF